MSANKSVTAHFELIRTLSFTGGANSAVPGSISSSPPGITCSWTGAPPPTPCTDSAPFLHGTTVTLTLVTGGSTIVWGGACAGTVGTVCTVLMDADKLVTLDTRFQFDPKSTMLLKASSELDVADGEGQVVTNGLAASAVRAGLAAMTTEARPGMNRVEAVLVRGAGRPGTWRFDFSGQNAFKAGSLRVIAGTVVLVTGDAVVFRLQGRPGERVVFTFEVQP
jgi:hypothetical protein